MSLDFHVIYIDTTVVWYNNDVALEHEFHVNASKFKFTKQFFEIPRPVTNTFSWNSLNGKTLVKIKAGKLVNLTTTQRLLRIGKVDFPKMFRRRGTIQRAVSGSMPANLVHSLRSFLRIQIERVVVLKIK